MALRRTRLIPALLAAAALAPAQRIISARAGFVYFVQGRVVVEGSGPLPFGDNKRQLRSGETLAADRGRAEVLLNPAAVLRLANASRLRMDSIELSDPCVTLLSGAAVITITQLPKNDLPKQDRIEVRVGAAIVVLSRPGVYRFDMTEQQSGLRVYRGRAGVNASGDSVIVTQGRSVDLDQLETAKFDTRQVDSFERWAELRSRPTAPPRMRLIPPPYSADTRSPAGLH